MVTTLQKITGDLHHAVSELRGAFMSNPGESAQRSPSNMLPSSVTMRWHGRRYSERRSPALLPRRLLEMRGDEVKYGPGACIKIPPALILSGRCPVFISGLRCTWLDVKRLAVLQLPCLPPFESPHLIFSFPNHRRHHPPPSLFPPLPPQIMNKIIFVCSMKFLPHFPPLMLILFKVYQLENILCNLNANDSSKYVLGRYITL